MKKNLVDQERVWIVVPARNEQQYIEQVLEKVKKVTANIVVIDDGSKDGTRALARAHTPHVLSHKVNLGKGAALKTGCEYAFQKLQAKAVIFLDADDQHDPTLIPEFIANMNKGSDVIFGVRDLEKNMPWGRVMANTFCSFLIALFFGLYLPDIPSGYKLLTRKAYTQVKWSSRGYAVELEIAAKVAKFHLPFSFVAIPTIYRDFNRGMTMLDAFGMFTQILNWRFSV
jgi:glycosyltransferase involved in cell wall biosynthesis